MLNGLFRRICTTLWKLAGWLGSCSPLARIPINDRKSVSRSLPGDFRLAAAGPLPRPSGPWQTMHCAFKNTFDPSMAEGLIGLPVLPLGRDGRPIRPSAIEGSKVFLKAQCIVCHGPEGLGNGPAAANLKSPGKDLLTDFLSLIGIRAKGEQLPSHPANFHNVVQMRLNSPFSMYETVTRGRPHTAMPSFGPRPAYGAATFGVRLTDEERWHVIFFEWAFSTTPAEVARGKQIYETRAMDVGGRMLT